MRLASKIVTEDVDTRTYNQIMKALKTLGQDYPIDEAFEQEDWYDYPEECRYFLWAYEEHLAHKAGTGATIDETEKARVWRLRAADLIEHISLKRLPALLGVER